MDLIAISTEDGQTTEKDVTVHTADDSLPAMVETFFQLMVDLKYDPDDTLDAMHDFAETYAESY